MNRQKPLRIAVIGAGAIATRRHIPCYLNNEHARVVALVDLDSKKVRRVAKKFGIKHSYRSLSGLLNSQDIDAASICTPPNSHSSIAIELLEGGVNVLCEKPLAENVDSCLEMITAAEGSNRILMTGLNRRFNPTYQKVRNLIDEGRVGHVFLTEFCALQRNPGISWSKASWFYDENIGGSLKDLGPHAFDMLNWFLGRPLSVYACARAHMVSPVDEVCVSTVSYEGGDVGIGIMGWSSPIHMEKLGVHGTGRSLYASPHLILDVNPTDILEISLWKSSTSLLLDKVKTLLNGRHVDTFQLEIDHFIWCIMSGHEPLTDGWVGLGSTAVTEAATLSVKEKKEIPIRQVS